MFRKTFYPGVPDRDWNDWRWQARNRLRTLAQLEQVLVLSDEERAALSDGGVASGPDDLYEVKLTRRTVPVVAYGRFSAGPVTVRAGAGLAFHRVSETWRTVDLDFTGNRTAPRFLLSASVRLAGRLSLLACATYDPLRVKKDLYSDSVDVGGLTAVAGLSLRIF